MRQETEWKRFSDIQWVLGECVLALTRKVLTELTSPNEKKGLPK